MKTNDGRDLTTTEWRAIPGFPKYQITPDGDVRNARTGLLLTETHNQRTGAYYYVLKKQMPDGKLKNHTRNYQTLLTATYTEAPETTGASSLEGK